VRLAARQAHIADFIENRPDGYLAYVGERGIRLSGGQRQRVALARAIYGDPKIIVLDEPNANLDEVGERSLVDAIRELKKKGSTLFLITHRLNILQVTDHICKMKDGMIEVYGERDDVLSLMKNEATHLKHTKTKSNDPTVH
jgi:ABC-type protease/lipase transport system fused ATPase/permease subunit